MPRVNMTDIRKYRMQLIEYVLCGIEPMTTSEVHQATQEAAATERHPREYWLMTRAEVAGLLRSMEAVGVVVVDRKAYRSAVGRDEPLWTVLKPMPTQAQIPSPPAEPDPPKRTFRAVEIMTTDRMADRSQDRSAAAVAAVIQQASKVSSASARLQAEVDALRRQIARFSKGGR